MTSFNNFSNISNDLLRTLTYINFTKKFMTYFKNSSSKPSPSSKFSSLTVIEYLKYYRPYRQH